MEPTRIGVVPAGELARRGRLFDALEQFLPVRFIAGCADVSACVTFGDGSASRHIPNLVLAADEYPTEGIQVPIELSTAGVDPRLRGRTLAECWIGTAQLSPVEGEVLANSGTSALWTRSGNEEHAALAPLELDPGEPLRNRLHPGRWFALAPLIQFLRTVGRDTAWTPPPPRAAFLLDDPNLHWTSYGFLRFAEVAAAARTHGYHVASATVPIDTWFIHPAAARTFRENPEQLSLLIHGNDHLAHELARPLDERQRHALLGQALRRIAAFERRSGVPVSRVMAAPHGVCSEEMASTMLAFDFEGLTISRPYPWLARPPAHWLASPPDGTPTVGMRPTELVAGGLPVLLRTTLQHSEDDLVLRAFLDQPLIVSGHHDDLAGGLDPLAEIADSINQIGGVRWGSLAQIARSSFSSRLENGVMRIQPHARVLSIDLADDAEALAVESPPDASNQQLLIDGAAMPFEEPVAIEAGRHELKIARRDALNPDQAPVRRARPWSVGRRIAAESRDRLQPVLGSS